MTIIRPQSKSSEAFLPNREAGAASHRDNNKNCKEITTKNLKRATPVVL
jgi:hypothetical protein